MIGALFLAIYGQSTYFVSSNGSDSSVCGLPNSTPCRSLNQVFVNFPGVSCSVVIQSAGDYVTTPIILQRDAEVSIEGADGPNIIAVFTSGSFLTLTNTSVVSLHDLSLTLIGVGDSFVTINTAKNVVGFYNISLSYSDCEADFIQVNGGELNFNDITLSGAAFGNYFVHDISTGEFVNITVVGSLFSNLSIGEYGALIETENSAGDVGIDASTFTDIIANYTLLNFAGQSVTISGCVLNNTYSFSPAIYCYDSNALVQNSTWINTSAHFMSGGFGFLKSDDRSMLNLTMDYLSFTLCTGQYAGALVVAYNTLVLSHSAFAGNHGSMGNDLVLTADAAPPPYSLTDCCSLSDLDRAVLWGEKNETLVDISDLLPNCPSDPDRSSSSSSSRFSPRSSFSAPTHTHTHTRRVLVPMVSFPIHAVEKDAPSVASAAVSVSVIVLERKE